MWLNHSLENDSCREQLSINSRVYVSGHKYVLDLTQSHFSPSRLARIKMKEVEEYHRLCSREMSQLIMSGSLGRAVFSLHCTIFSNF